MGYREGNRTKYTVGGKHGLVSIIRGADVGSGAVAALAREVEEANRQESAAAEDGQVPQGWMAILPVMVVGNSKVKMMV